MDKRWISCTEILLVSDLAIEGNGIEFKNLFPLGSNAGFHVKNTSRVYSTENDIIIEEAQEIDEGWYYCIARNSGKSLHLYKPNMGVVILDNLYK